MFAFVLLVMAELVIADVAQELVQRGGVVSAVVGDADGNVAVVVEGLDQVAASHFHRVDADSVADLVHQAFQQERSLGAAGAAVGFDGCGVGEHAVDVGRDVGDVVRAGVHQAVQNGRDTGSGGGQIGAHAGVDHAADSGDLAVGVGRHLHVFDVVTAVGGGHVVFGTGLSPFDRDAQLHGTEGGDHFPGIDGDLGAETAADFGGDHPDLVLRNAGDQAGHEPGDVRVLGGVPKRQFAHGRRPRSDSRAGLHGSGDELLLVDGLADRHGSVGECDVGIAAGRDPVESLVVGRVLMQLRSAVGQGGLRVDDGRQRGIADVDEFQGVLGLVAVFRYDHSYRVTHVSHHVRRDGGVGHGLQIGVRNGPGAGDGVQHAFDVSAGVDGEHARRGFGRVGVDAGDARVGVGAAQDGRVDHAGQLDVVGVGGLTGDQARVLASPDAGSENSGSHGVSLLVRQRRRPERP